MFRSGLFLIFFLASCIRVGPDYVRPDIEIPDEYHYAQESDTGSLNLPWWNQFDDPVLVHLIHTALENNEQLKIASANVIASLGVLIQTQSELFPQIGYQSAGSRFLQSRNVANSLPLNAVNPFSNYQLGATLHWQIDFWGRIQRQIEAARNTLYASQEARRVVILSLVSAVASQYITLRGLDEQLIIAEKTLESYQEALTYFSHQFDYGQASKMAVAQAETQVEQARTTIPAIQLQIVAQENSLSVLLGKNPMPIPRGKSIYGLHLPEIPSDLPSDILEMRPNIREAEDTLIANNALIGAAKALYFPQISLTANYGVASDALTNLFLGPSKTWDYTGAIIGPIFTWGGIYGQVVQAEAQALGALENYKLAIQEAFAEVETSLAAHRYLQDQLEALGKLVNAAQEYVRLSQLQFKGGYSPYFVVLQAQQQLFPSELSWAQIRAQLFVSIVNIYQAMGGGWVTLADQLTSPETDCPQ